MRCDLREQRGHVVIPRGAGEQHPGLCGEPRGAPMGKPRFPAPCSLLALPAAPPAVPSTVLLTRCCLATGTRNGAWEGCSAPCPTLGASPGSRKSVSSSRGPSQLHSSIPPGQQRNRPTNYLLISAPSWGSPWGCWAGPTVWEHQGGLQHS